MNREPKLLKKIPKTSELMWIFGTIFIALGVSLSMKANLGISMIAAPAFIIFEAISPYFSWLSVGVVEYVMQGLILIVMCIVIRKFRVKFLFTFAAAIIYGYVLDMWILILGAEPFDEIYLRWIMLFLGIISTALGVACFFRTYLPLQVYELFVSEVSNKYGLKIGRFKWVFDSCCFVLAIILAFTIFGDVNTFDWSSIATTSFHSIGLGTICTTIFTAPMIMVWSKLLSIVFSDTALFPRFKEFLKNGKKFTKKSQTTSLKESAATIDTENTNSTPTETAQATEQPQTTEQPQALENNE